MNIDFNRCRFQTTYELILGITTSDELPYHKEIFKNYVLNEGDVFALRKELYLDGLDFLSSGMISFAEAIDGVFYSRFSWATIKLYYSIFYILRATLAFRGIGILRNKSMFRLRVATGEKLFGTNNKKYNSTHDGVINHYKDIYSSNDKLMTNQIDDTDVYSWMKEIREVVNYKNRILPDPLCLDFWNNYKVALDEGNLNDLLKEISKDSDFIYCFQEEYAILAIPLKRLMLTVDENREELLVNEQFIKTKKYMKAIDRTREFDISLFL